MTLHIRLYDEDLLNVNTPLEDITLYSYKKVFGESISDIQMFAFADTITHIRGTENIVLKNKFKINEKDN